VYGGQRDHLQPQFLDDIAAGYHTIDRHLLELLVRLHQDSGSFRDRRPRRFKSLPMEPLSTLDKGCVRRSRYDSGTGGILDALDVSGVIGVVVRNQDELDVLFPNPFSESACLSFL